MNMFMKKMLNAVLPDPQPENCDDDDHADNPLHITPMDFTVHDKNEHICLFDELSYWNSDEN